MKQHGLVMEIVATIHHKFFNTKIRIFTASLPTLGSILGNLLIGLSIDRHGRKVSFLFNTIPAFVGCLLLAGPQKTSYLFVGQLCMGVSQGAATLAPAVYIAESISPHNLQFRSSLTSWNVMAINFGLFLVYLLGWLFHYTYVALIGAAISLTSTLLIFFLIPESPAWLDQKGRHKEAERARYELGVPNPRVDSSPLAYQPILENFEDEDFITYLSKIRRKDVYKPLLITVGYFFFQQFSGTQVFSAYMVDIIRVKSISADPYLMTVISGLIIILSQIFYSIILPVSGLRKIAIISSVGYGVTTLILGLCIYAGDTFQFVDYIHILTVWCNVFVAGFGIANIPYAIIGEIFPVDAKGFASVPVFSVGIFYFAILMIYPYTLVLSTYGVYFGFAAIGFISVFFIYYCLPETVGKTLEEISFGFLT